MASLWADIRFAFRMMGKNLGYTAVLVLTLALGIGASTTIFSVVNSVVLKPLPYRQPEQLVRFYTEFPTMKLLKFWISPPEYFDLARGCRSCSSVGAWTMGTASLSGSDRPRGWASVSWGSSCCPPRSTDGTPCRAEPWRPRSRRVSGVKATCLTTR